MHAVCHAIGVLGERRVSGGSRAVHFCSRRRLLVVGRVLSLLVVEGDRSLIGILREVVVVGRILLLEWMVGVRVVKRREVRRHW